MTLFRLPLLARRFCTSSSTSFSNVTDLFSNSLSCAQLQYKDKKIFVIGDKTACKDSWKRIENVIQKLKPSVICLETENPHIGDQDSKWRRPNPIGKVIKDSYISMYANDYPNMANTFRDYQQDTQTNAVNIIQWTSNLKKQSSPSQPIPELIFSGQDLPGQLYAKNNAGQLGDLTVQFQEEIFAMAKKHKYEQRAKKPQPNRAPVSFFGAMEGLDEKEEADQERVQRESIADVNKLAKLFNDRILNHEQFAEIMNTSNDLKSIFDYDLLSSKEMVRILALNQLLRSLSFDKTKDFESFFNAMKLLFVNRDRIIFRVIREYMEVMKGGSMLTVVNLVHVYGVETLWNNEQFWKDENLSRDWVERQAKKDPSETARNLDLPFFGSNK